MELVAGHFEQTLAATIGALGDVLAGIQLGDHATGAKTAGVSTDCSTELIRARASRLAALESAPDGGQAHTIAKSFAKTSGLPTNIMAWINSDDFYMPAALRYVAEYFARNPDVVVVYRHRVVVNREARRLCACTCHSTTPRDFV